MLEPTASPGNDREALALSTSSWNTIGSSLSALMILGDEPTISRWQREKAGRVRGKVACRVGCVVGRKKHHIIYLRNLFMYQMSNAGVLYLRCNLSHLWARCSFSFFLCLNVTFMLD